MTPLQEQAIFWEPKVKVARSADTPPKAPGCAAFGRLHVVLQIREHMANDSLLWISFVSASDLRCTISAYLCLTSHCAAAWCRLGTLW